MGVMLEIIDTEEFWTFYQLAPEDSLSDEFLTQYADWVHDEEWDENEYDPLTVRFKVLNDYALNLQVRLDSWSISLDFHNLKTKRRYEIGWWDWARWHPYGLQWHELITMYNYWLDRPGKIPVDPDVAFLLLAKFVGIPVKEKVFLKECEVDIKTAYDRLSYLSPELVSKLAKRTIFSPSEKDYVWADHPKLGPTFSGSYPCYSIRNEAHSEGGEGLFPFQDFPTMIAKIEKHNPVD